MLKVGLTGGIGSGKSTIATQFSRRGIPVVDADAISRELTQDGAPAVQAIAREFGADLVKNGELDRRLLAERAFADPVQRQRLEALLHPLIRAEIQHRAAALSAPYCIIVIPLLFESGQQDLVDRILVVDANESVRTHRVRLRDNRSGTEIRKIMENQTDRQTRLAAADDVIVNEGGVGDLDVQVESLHKKYLALGSAATHN